MKKIIVLMTVSTLMIASIFTGCTTPGSSQDSTPSTSMNETDKAPTVSLDKAREIALAHAGVTAENVVFDDKEYDVDDGIAVYELEFTADGITYEYNVDAQSGEILSHEFSLDDDYDDDNDDDDDD